MGPFKVSDITPCRKSFLRGFRAAQIHTKRVMEDIIRSRSMLITLISHVTFNAGGACTILYYIC